MVERESNKIDKICPFSIGNDKKCIGYDCNLYIIDKDSGKSGCLLFYYLYTDYRATERY